MQLFLGDESRERGWRKGRNLERVSDVCWGGQYKENRMRTLSKGKLHLKVKSEQNYAILVINFFLGSCLTGMVCLGLIREV